MLCYIEVTWCGKMYNMRIDILVVTKKAITMVQRGPPHILGRWHDALTFWEFNNWSKIKKRTAHKDTTKTFVLTLSCFKLYTCNHVKEKVKGPPVHPMNSIKLHSTLKKTKKHCTVHWIEICLCFWYFSFTWKI